LLLGHQITAAPRATISSTSAPRSPTACTSTVLRARHPSA
jgi:hypothetical protein